MSVQISRDEWLKALGDTVRPLDPSAVTVNELAELLNIGRQAAYLRVRKLVDEGRATVAMKEVPSKHGIPKRVTAYKLKDKGRKR